MKWGKRAGVLLISFVWMLGLGCASNAQWYSEKQIKKLRKSSRAVVTLAQASVRLDVHPKGALVYVDGNLAGTVQDFNGSNERLFLFPGRHTLELRDPDYETFSTDVKVLPEQDFRLKVRMHKRE
ncbi:MAG: PEGA domain-containing protein [Acidobacteriia bacterium]|nr:PEGA domain-containing protein [Terriglobia bacterium]